MVTLIQRGQEYLASADRTVLGSLLDRISDQNEASFDTYLRERPEMPEAVDGYA